MIDNSTNNSYKSCLSARKIIVNLLKKQGEEDFLTESLSVLFAFSSFSNLDKRFIQEIVYGIVRYRKRLDYYLNNVLPLGMTRLPKDVVNILRLGAYQLIFLDKVPDFAAVSTSVELAKDLKYAKYKNLVNGALRKLASIWKNVPMPDENNNPIKYLSVYYSMPDWLIKKQSRIWEYNELKQWCESSNRISKLSIRINTLKIETDAFLGLLEKQKIGYKRSNLLPEALIIENATNPVDLPGYKDGYFVVQDISSILPVLALSPKPGEIIIDACAAPGGKLTQIADMMKDTGKIYAVEPNKKRLRKLLDNISRLGLKSIEVINSKAEEIPVDILSTADRVLIDAPCSGSGTFSRRVDLRWRLTVKHIENSVENQRKILFYIGGRLKQKGLIGYSTCSIFPEENALMIKDFLEEMNNKFRVKKIDFVNSQQKSAGIRQADIAESGEDSTEINFGHNKASLANIISKAGFVETYSHRHNVDGSFAAVLVRS